ncbi:hypothetical protein GCM10012286_23450 [Streptomyces lasiicapitis]|uniref:Uncharacterized protein n=1 Tax=Streptomyces lasiicapitis TaxID=1923961 RepID=A0ABQ2LRS8_9ACTN|nr:hypothetical protein GCM10012286_23450 [Streptomyces lasiicapitis]
MEPRVAPLFAREARAVSGAHPPTAQAGLFRKGGHPAFGCGYWFAFSHVCPRVSVSLSVALSATAPVIASVTASVAATMTINPGRLVARAHHPRVGSSRAGIVGSRG